MLHLYNSSILVVAEILSYLVSNTRDLAQLRLISKRTGMTRLCLSSSGLEVLL